MRRSRLGAGAGREVAAAAAADRSDCVSRLSSEWRWGGERRLRRRASGRVVDGAHVEAGLLPENAWVVPRTAPAQEQERGCILP